MRPRGAAWAGCVVSVGVVAIASACLGTPASAQDLWDRPAESSVQDAHVSVGVVGQGATSGGAGVVVFRPRLAMSLSLQAVSGGVPGELDVLQVGGTTYQRTGAGAKWARSTAAPPDPMWDNASDPRLVGQDRLDGTPAWHLRAIRGASPVEMWVRVSDGYPLRLVTTAATGSTFTFTFGDFNSHARLAAPPASDLQPAARHLAGGMGDALALNGATVTLTSADVDAQPADAEQQPRPGDRYVVVGVLVENTGAGPLSTFLDWRLNDASGTTWAEAVPVRQPTFVGDELAPGQSAQGYLTYEVDQAATGLTLTVRVGDDTATFVLPDED